MKIFYAAGPGNVMGTYRRYIHGKHDPNQTAITYSSQFFDVCRELGVHAKVVTRYPRRESLNDEWIQFENWQIPWLQTHGIRYRLGYIWYAIRLSWAILRYGTDVAVISEFPYWYFLSPLRWLGVKIIPSIHCVLWRTHIEQRFRERLLWRVNGWFFRNCVAGVMCVSNEIGRQVSSLLKGASVPIISFIPTYMPETFQADNIQAAPSAAGRRSVLFVGRVEHDKGVFDLVEIAKELARKGLNDIGFDVCGVGGALDELKRSVAASGLSDRFVFHGYVEQPQLATIFQSAFVVIVPTRTSFIEGFNKVVAEGILSRKPVITSPVCPAVEYFGEGIVLVPPDDFHAYATAIKRLVDDPDFYASTVVAADQHRAQLFEETRSWGATFRRLLSQVCTDQLHSRTTGLISPGRFGAP